MRELDRLPALLTVDQVLQLRIFPAGSIGRNGLYSAVKRGELPCVRLGRKIFLPRSAVSRLLGEQATEAASNADA